MDLIRIDNYEETPLETDDFRFRCFTLADEDTPPHWHNHSEILYIQKGCCSVFVNGSNMECGEGDLVFVPRGSLHGTLSQQSYRYCALVIGDSLLHPVLGDYHWSAALSPFISGPPCEPIHIEHAEAGGSGLSGVLESLIDEYTRRDRGYEGMIKALLCRFFTLLLRLNPELKAVDKQDRMTLKMKQVIQQISSRYSHKILQADIAAANQMSSQHFCRVFKAYTGKSFVNYLNDYRLEQAEKLLKETDLPVTRIPELTGFCNVNYFSRLYRAKYGCCPSKSRKKSSMESDRN